MLAEAGNKTINSHQHTDSQSLLKNEQVEIEECAFIILVDKLKLIFDLKWGGFIRVSRKHKG